MKVRVITNEPHVVQLAVQLLQERGWVCIPPDQAQGELLSPAAAGRKVGLKPSALWRRLNSSKCPPYYGERGNTGRLLRLKLTPEVEAFLRRPLATNAGIEAIVKQREAAGGKD